MRVRRCSALRGPLGRKKRVVAGRPLRSGWRPRGARLIGLAIAPVLLGAAVFAVDATSGRNPGIAPVVDAQTQYTLGGRKDDAGEQTIKGHGRGLSQLGSYAYAKQGWAAERILGYYYGTATLGDIPPTAITVRLQGRDNQPLAVISDAGANVAGRHVDPGEAVHLTPTPGGADVTITEGCTGNQVWAGSTDNPWVDPVDLAPDRPGNEHLKICGTDSTYRGALGVASENGQARTVNHVDVDDYLLGVVPAEMQPNWADSGGAEALRAQAIAARSYAIAEKRWDYAQTCDTTDCQMYSGAGKEDQRTTDAVRSTSGKVLMSDGAVYRAEYFAGADVAADAIWSKTVTAGDIANAFGVGNLDSVTVTERGDGGRVQKLRVVGSDKTVEVSGAEAAEKLALPSDNFDISTPPAAAAVPNDSGALAAPDTPTQDGTAPAPNASPTPNTVDAAGQASAIDDLYRNMGGLNSTIGAPIGPEFVVPEGLGKFRIYTNGAIVWNPDLGAHAVDLSVISDLLATK